MLLKIQPTRRNKITPLEYNDNASNINRAIDKFYIEVVSQPVIDKLKLENKKQEPLKPKDFRKNIQVNLIKTIDLISVSYKHSDPLLAEKIVNALMEEYIRNDIYSNVPSTIMRRDFLVKEPAYWNEKVSRDIKLKAVKEYWKEIEVMNENVPEGIKSKRYQSHNARIAKVAISSCSVLGYLK